MLSVGKKSLKKRNFLLKIGTKKEHKSAKTCGTSFFYTHCQTQTAWLALNKMKV